MEQIKETPQEELIKDKQIKLCSRCKQNPATIKYTASVTDFTHGFIENICQECYDKVNYQLMN